MTAEKIDIETLFHPNSIALVGASSDPGKIGYKILHNIIEGGFPGSVYPVNPKGGKIRTLPVHTSVAAISGAVDIAVIAVPARHVMSAVRDCCKAGVKYCLIIASGFSEIGKREEEKEIVAYARKRGMRVLGPNMFGIYSSAVSLNATFGPDRIQAGGVAIVSQSGALGLSMIGRTALENLGLSTIVSLGNKADLTEVELLDYLGNDSNTEVILIYLEGVRDGESFLQALRRATGKKPVVIIKSGRSDRGAAAAASHTGSLAGADRVFDDLIRQCGALRAESIAEAFDLCRFLSAVPLKPCHNTLIVTNGGGIGVLATDAAEKHRLPLFDDPNALKEHFGGIIPAYGSARNPLDLTGEAGPEDYEKALKTARNLSEVGAVIALYCETAVFNAESLAAIFTRHFEDYRKIGRPLVFSTMGGQETEAAGARLRKARIPVFSDVYAAVRCMGALHRYATAHPSPAEALRQSRLPLEKIEDIAAGARGHERYFLLADEAAGVLESAAIPLPGRAVVRTAAEAVSAAGITGYPVALKIVSRDILHKSDVGGVALSLQNEEELINGYEGIIGNVRRRHPGADIAGVEVSAMAPPGLELIVGARRDPVFGPVVMAGLGGVYVEVLKDVAFAAAPLTRDEVFAMLQQLRGFPLLLGVRGEEPKEIEMLVDVIEKLGEIVTFSRSIADIEINPLFVYDQGEGILAVDARILLSSETVKK